MTWTILPISEFESIKDQWQQLNALCGDSPLLQPRFLCPLIHEFSTGEELIAIKKHNDIIEAAAIIFKIRFGVWQTFQPSQAPIGAWLQLSNLNTFEILKSLAKYLPGFCIMIGITQQDPDLLTRPQEIKNLSTLDYIDTARITINKSFDEYWSERGKNLRNNIKKQYKKLNKENIIPRLEVDSSIDTAEECIKDYGMLESAGWKSKGGTSIHPENSQGKFYIALLKEFCKTGDGMVFKYYFNNELAATDLCIINGDIIIILKTTYNENLRNHSPAVLMHHEAFRLIFETGKFRKIEFYGKVMDWHTKWTEETRNMYHFTYNKWPLISRLKSLFSSRQK